MCSDSNCGTDIDDNDGDFCFETENLALRGNKDYLKLLRTLCVLESQRSQALRDIDRLLEIREEAAENPIEFIGKLERGEDLGIPVPQAVPDLPEIEWGKYKVALPPEALRPQTRYAGHRTQTESNGAKQDVIKVRGRVYDNSKPVTFNQLWTVEEQLRLEELLVKFPPEENETKRYMKIAEALGNRTVTQVSSRCQKYFLKLQKAGLPVPGRTPKMKTDFMRSPKYTGHQHSRNNVFLYPRSTFFPQLIPPVAMHEGEDLPGTTVYDPNKVKVEDPESGDEDNFSDDVKRTDDFKKFLLLKRIKKDMEKDRNSIKAIQNGYRCNACNEEPMIGTRWHCTDCNEKDSVDFCSECLISQLESDAPHPLDHRFVSIRNPENSALDREYSYQNYLTNSSSYNYLDPNFMPQ